MLATCRIQCPLRSASIKLKKSLIGNQYTYHVCTLVSERWILCSLYFLLDKGRVAENLQKECLCYFIIFSTSLWRNHFNHIQI